MLFPDFLRSFFLSYHLLIGVIRGSAPFCRPALGQGRGRLGRWQPCPLNLWVIVKLPTDSASPFNEVSLLVRTWVSKGHLQQEWVLGEGARAPMPMFLL